MAKGRVTPVQGHLRLSHERGVLCGMPGDLCERLSPLFLSSYHLTTKKAVVQGACEDDLVRG